MVLWREFSQRQLSMRCCCSTAYTVLYIHIFGSRGPGATVEREIVQLGSFFPSWGRSKGDRMPVSGRCQGMKSSISVQEILHKTHFCGVECLLSKSGSQIIVKAFSLFLKWFNKACVHLFLCMLCLPVWIRAYVLLMWREREENRAIEPLPTIQMWIETTEETRRCMIMTISFAA